MAIYNHIGVCWKNLARVLEFDEIAVRTIQDNNLGNCNEQCMNMLSSYYQKAGSSFTKLKLVEAMIAADLREIVEKCNLCKFFN